MTTHHEPKAEAWLKGRIRLWSFVGRTATRVASTAMVKSMRAERAAEVLARILEQNEPDPHG